jgi:hypothetical protein
MVAILFQNQSWLGPGFVFPIGAYDARRMPRTPPYKGWAIAFGCSPHLVRFERRDQPLPTIPGLRPDKPHRRQAKPPGLPPQSQIGRCLFRSFHRMAETRPSRSRLWALCPHRRYRRDKPRDGELAAASFAPLELAGFSDGPALTVEITAPPLDISNPSRHTSLRSEKHDSGKMEKHSWRQFLGISHVMLDTWLVGYRS